MDIPRFNNVTAYCSESVLDFGNARKKLTIERVAETAIPQPLKEMGKMGKHFPRYVEIMNEAAFQSGYENVKQFYVRDYKSDPELLNEKAQEIMQRIQPLYEHE
ncbi:Angiotensin-converting enzyme [Orchesella cincta]|uniref:Angiotensin-converting enzyme n=1 Tax=Orchesella cincta TaxID=48709 RepID=A0A1D2NER6_ORCCI|nr:Angiotensin-converting enzyme [Orchesella cincta]